MSSEVIKMIDNVTFFSLHCELIVPFVFECHLFVLFLSVHACAVSEMLILVVLLLSRISFCVSPPLVMPSGAVGQSKINKNAADSR